MPWINGTFHRSNGDNSGATTWQQDQSEDVAILAPRHDEHDQDFADGLNEVAGGLGTFAKTDIASAATCNIGAVDTSVVRITGTAPIISLGTVPNTRKWVYFADVLTLTYNATSLILPGAANIVTAAGDAGLFVADASGNWRCWEYQFAVGTPTAGIANDAVTFAKMQNIATDSLIGRDTAGTGDPETILLNATLEMDGSGNLRRAALTGDVTASAGSNATSIANDAVTNAKLANMATATFKGRTTAGTGDPEDLTATQATALLNTVVGDSGAGGTKGLVPAPGAGDAAAGKFLKADGTFALPAAGVYIPTAFTSAAIQAAVDLAAAAGGGTVQLLDGDYAMSAAATISSDDIWLLGSADTRLLAPNDATAIAGLITVSGAVGTDTTLGSNAAIGDRTITLTSAANIAVGDYVRIVITKVTTGYAYHMETVCTAKVSNDITLSDPLPFAATTADTTSIRQTTLRHRVKIKGLRFGGNGNSGLTRAIRAQRMAYSAIEDIYCEGFHGAAAIYYDQGYRNSADNLRAYDCGDANESDISIVNQTGFVGGRFQSTRASGFGPQFQGLAYGSIESVNSEKSSGRGIKLHSTVFSKFGSLIGNNSTSTGVAISLGSCDNVIGEIIALSNRAGSGNDIGLWFSAQDNVRNQIGRVNLKNNLDWDIDIGSTDNDNRIANAIYTTRRDQGSRNLAGIPDASFISGGYAVSVNANSVADTAIAINCPTANYRISSVVIQNVGTTASLTTAQFGIFTATGGGGTAISAAGQVLTALTSNTTGANGALLNHVPATNPTAVWTMAANSTLYFRITTAQGAAATLRVYFVIQPLPSA